MDSALPVSVSDNSGTLLVALKFMSWCHKNN